MIPAKPDWLSDFQNVVVRSFYFKKGDKIPVAIEGGGVARKVMPSSGCIYVDRQGREMIAFDSDELSQDEVGR